MKEVNNKIFKRKDSKGRLLHQGESQRPDGRYRFKASINGETVEFCSWRLMQTDPNPKGKKMDLSLREKEARLQADRFNGLVSRGGNMTVLELVEKYCETKTGVKETTRKGYKTVINFLKKDSFGSKRIDKITISDAKIWLIKLQKEKKKSYSTIHTIRGVLRPAFQQAFEDDLIRKNPFQFELATVVVNDSVTREAITRDQERKLLKFIAEDNHFNKYYDGIFVLFNTGLRISEFVRLTKRDIDFKNHKVIVREQLMRSSDMQYYVEDSTKTVSGTRLVPMSPEVEQAFRRIIKNRPTPKIEPIIDGCSGFLFLDKNENPTVALHWEHYFNHIVEKYNSIYKVQMPNVTPHVCRHTFCSKMAKSGMNPKVLQYIMGHADISVTLNVYTHVQAEDAAEEFARVINL